MDKEKIYWQFEELWRRQDELAAWHRKCYWERQERQDKKRREQEKQQKEEQK